MKGKINSGSRLSTKDRSLAVGLANRLRSRGLSFSDGLRRSYLCVRLIGKMRGGEADFEYIKGDGSIRRAVGTLCLDVIGRVGSGEAGIDRGGMVVRYYDIGKMGWRSFRVDRLV